MGEVIKHNFGGDQVEPEKLEPKKDNLQMVMGLAGLLGDGKQNENFDKFIKTMKKLGEMRKVIDSLQVVSSHETNVLRQDLVSRLSFEEACDIVLGSDEMQWKEKPSYYRAVSNWFSLENLAKVLQDSSK